MGVMVTWIRIDGERFAVLQYVDNPVYENVKKEGRNDEEV